MQDENILRDVNPDNIVIFEKPPGFLLFKICNLDARDFVFPAFKLALPRK